MSDTAVRTVVLHASPELLADPTVAWAIDHLKRASVDAGLPSRGSTVTSLDVHLEYDRNLGPEAYRQNHEGGSVRVAFGGVRGCSYALTEMAAALAAGDLDLSGRRSVSQSPAVPIRGIARAFGSVDEDAPWFHDRSFWRDYLDELARNRFNRFHLAFGMQFNYGTIDKGLTDNYLAFAYPFLLEVPGYAVLVDGLPPEERNRNLESLRFIARETRCRGMQFSLGLWTHAYAFPAPTRHRFPILGIDDENHARYCSAALARLLAEIPEIDALTFRVHFEAGIKEATQEVFWAGIFQSIGAAGREIDVDLHAKGVGTPLLQAARQHGVRASLSGKYWAEHLGLPYHQTAIRPRETARHAPPGETMSTLASYTRLFTRYGYADYLAENSQTGFFFRMWPGTQKLLLWGDPALAAGYGRYATFGGARGVEFCEPLFFKGRKGGRPGERDPYVRDDLRLGVQDWRKYRYTYLLWGRLLYDPQADPRTWRRLLESDYGDGAAAVEAGLGALSRILPLVSVVHGVSGANNLYWPEIYVDLPVSAGLHSEHYDKNYEWDGSTQQNWGGVSPFDPAMFYGIADYARDLLADALGPRYTPLEIAAWIDAMTDAGDRALTSLDGMTVGNPAQQDRTRIDMQVLVRLGRFFAGKFRASTDYALFEHTRHPQAIRSAIAHLEAARAAFADIVAVVDGVYQSDLVFGTELSEHGHWSQRLEAIDDDLRTLQLERDRSAPAADTAYEQALERHRTGRSAPDGVAHEPARFDYGTAHVISLTAPEEVIAATLLYRPVDQSKSFGQQVMQRTAGGFVAEIPAELTTTGYPLMYYFVLQREGEPPLLWPGLSSTLANQPYFSVSSTGTEKGRR